jgi:uncharacterized protein YuzE
MEAVKILEKAAELSWDYDAEADVLYLSVGKPRPAAGVDVGEGVVLRYDPVRREMVGLTVVGVRARLLRGLSQSADIDAVAVRDQPPVTRDKPRPKRGR